MAETFILSSRPVRQVAAGIVMNAPDGWAVTISEPKRNADQNARMWAMLTDISRAQPEGRKLTPEDWKCVFMNACGWEVAFLEGLDGRPFPAGWRTSRMTKRQMANLITYIAEYGDRNGVRWSEPNPYERAS